MKKTLSFLLLFLGLLFVGETTLARTLVMDANVQTEQGVSLSADEMQSIRGGETGPLLLCADFAATCLFFSTSWWMDVICVTLGILCVIL